MKPVLNPGTATVFYEAESLRQISGRLPATFNIIRTIGGLSLPVGCIALDDGANIGSCSYSDICKDFTQGVFGLNETNCPPELAEWGIDCTCPFDLPIQLADGSLTFQLDIPNDLSFIFGPGDYDLTVTVNNAANQHIGCFRFKFSMIRV